MIKQHNIWSDSFIWMRDSSIRFVLPYLIYGYDALLFEFSEFLMSLRLVPITQIDILNVNNFIK